MIVSDQAMRTPTETLGFGCFRAGYRDVGQVWPAAGPIKSLVALMVPCHGKTILTKDLKDASFIDCYTKQVFTILFIQAQAVKDQTQ